VPGGLRQENDAVGLMQLVEGMTLNGGPGGLEGRVPN